ncbi:DinB family protein [Herbidospora mongoliensis]|uniref:DinB family protein n=1 Tax=Herbidospora mongoliensis TaxID=688067 RepID=UPI00082E4712|nr:DinB family protein [Herbidospora mongoliensis]
MDLRTDRVGLLLDQLKTSIEFTKARLEGLTDDEYFWEPAPGNSWTVRRRLDGDENVYGRGDWIADFALQEPFPPPVTSIGWRLTHLVACFALRWDWTFGDRRMLFDDIEIPHTADDAQKRLWEIVERWSEDVDRLTEEQLDTVGFSQFPAGLDPTVPFVAIVWWLNREFVHHAAEVALLRDLYRENVNQLRFTKSAG